MAQNKCTHCTPYFDELLENYLSSRVFFLFIFGAKGEDAVGKSKREKSEGAGGETTCGGEQSAGAGTR